MLLRQSVYRETKMTPRNAEKTQETPRNAEKTHDIPNMQMTQRDAQTS